MTKIAPKKEDLHNNNTIITIKDYIFALILGYREPPAGVEIRQGLHYNPYFPGHAIAMAQQLYDGIVEYKDGLTLFFFLHLLVFFYFYFYFNNLVVDYYYYLNFTIMIHPVYNPTQ